MFRMTGTLVVGLVVLGVATTARAQGTAIQKGAAPTAKGAAGAMPTIPGATDVLATVTSHNQTDKVTKGDAVSFLSRYPLPPPEEREIAYNKAMEILVNTHLLHHFLAAQRIEVPASKIDEQVERREGAAPEGGPGLAQPAGAERLVPRGDAPGVRQQLPFRRILPEPGDGRRPQALPEREPRSIRPHPGPREPHPAEGRAERQQAREGQGQAEARGDPQGDRRRQDHRSPRRRTSTPKTRRTPAARAAISTTSRSTAASSTSSPTWHSSSRRARSRSRSRRRSAST